MVRLAQNLATLTWLFAATMAVAVSCSANSGNSGYTGGGAGGTEGTGAFGGLGGLGGQSGTTDGGGTGGTAGDAGSCDPHCSADYRAVVGCNETVLQLCAASDMCAEAQCRPACEAAELIRSSVGCEYYPVQMQGHVGSRGGCFALFVANSWPTPAHVNIDYRAFPLDPATFGYLTSGTGSSLTYEPLDPVAGIPPGEVAIFLLAGPNPLAPGGSVECPHNTTAAVTDGTPQVDGTGLGHAFHVTSDVPVVAYQMLPYGGGSAAVTGASLLLPTTVWDTNYVAVNAYRASDTFTRPSLNVVAMEDATQVQMVPNADVVSEGGLIGAGANTVMSFTLNRGQVAQITQLEELTGSPIEANKPIALMAGHECLQIPTDAQFCDHAEQQIPPVKALGHEYVAASHRQRSSAAESPVWRIIGAVNGTQLTFDPTSTHPAQTLQFGEVLEFTRALPFVVRSQDAAHPFILTTYMTGSGTVQAGYGDPDFVRMVPPAQYLQRYVFFTDPTYPETNLVVIREAGANGFEPVTLDCAGELTNWLAVGTEGRFEVTAVDLVRHDFEPQGACDNGPHEVSSNRPFGLWVWGWGTPETTFSTQNVSYAYPAGESVVQLNDVFIPPIPR